jgi:hypothetical protein
MARPKGALNKVNATAKSIALAALASVDQVELWRKHLMNEDPRVSIAADVYGHLVPGANRAAVNRLPSLSSFEVNSSAV